MSIANSAALQMRSVKALMFKRFRTKHSGSRAGYAWAIVEPIVWVFVLKFGIAHHDNSPPVGDSWEVFFTTGIVMGRMWRNATQSILGVFRKKATQSFPAISRLDKGLAIWLMEMTTGGVVMVIILSALGLWGFHVMPANPLSCLITFSALAVFSISFALALALLLNVFPVLNHFKNILMMAMFFTSGFASVLDRMPPEFRAIVSWNPLVHFVEWFREGFYQGYECVNLDLQYAFTVTIISLLIGLLGERALRRRPVNDGVRYADADD